MVTVTIVKPGAAKASESKPEPARVTRLAEPERIVSVEPHEVPVERTVPVEEPAQEKPAETLVAKAADYIVGAGDVLTITSYEDEHLTGKFTVAADGTIAYPFLGSVKVARLSVTEVEARLKKSLRDGEFFSSPRITVAVLEYRNLKINISGEVRTPGAYPFGGETTLAEALKRAGGMLPTASGEAIVTHRNYNAPLVDPIKVNLRDMENGVESENIVLRDGDVVFVTRAGTYYAFGYVNRPNAYPLLSPKTTVQMALALAGGVSERGSEKRIEITRVVNGTVHVIKDVQLTDIVQSGDTITVKERQVTINGAVKTPGLRVTFREGLTVLDLVNAAGGFAEQGGEPAPPEFTIYRIDPATGKGTMIVKTVQASTVVMLGDVVTVRIPRAMSNAA
jgi:polysaccharide export outer membrane protein